MIDRSRILGVLLAVAIAAAAALTSACGGSRETTKAALMADQVMEAMQVVLAEEASRDPLERDFDAFAHAFDEMLRTGRELQLPVIQRLDQGRGIQAPTTVAEAVHDLPTFRAKAGPIIAAATAEAEAATWWRELGTQSLRYLGEVASSSLSMGLMGGGGLSLIGSTLALLRSSRNWKTAAVQAIDHGRRTAAAVGEVLATAPPEVRTELEAKAATRLEAEKLRSERAQQAAGVHGLIKPIVKRAA
jgi:hypothetical protein